jgi:hypothetical protein
MGINIGCVDEAAIRIHVGIEDTERRFFVVPSAKKHGSQTERADVHAGLT